MPRAKMVTMIMEVTCILEAVLIVLNVSMVSEMENQVGGRRGLYRF
jgi:hypothetical protein